MADNSRFDFCPRCGALARDGVCTSCGYRNDQQGATPPQYQPTQQGVVPPQYQPTQQGAVQPQYQPIQQGAVQPQYQPQQQGAVPLQYQTIQQGAAQPYQGVYQPYAQAVPPAGSPVKKKSKTAVIVSIIAGIVLIAIIALILAGVASIQKRNRNKDVVSGAREHGWEAETEEIPDIEEESGNESSASSPAYSHYSEDVTQENWEEEGQDAAFSYYTGPYNALRDDLSYEIAFTRETYCSQGSENVFLQVEYPQITTKDYRYRELINAALYYEYGYYMDFFKEEFKPLMRYEEDTFQCEINSYVTYMDEKILSVVFRESIYLELEGDPFRVFDFFCVNFDLETGNILKDTEVLNIDEDFALDFRQREINENGDEALTDYSDEEVLEMLRDEGTLVLFYTPMGLEVGLNLPGHIVYVTYEDYEQYLNSF